MSNITNTNIEGLSLQKLNERANKQHAALKANVIEGATLSWELGETLSAAKSECRHGDWLPFLRHANIHERVAQKCIRLYTKCSIEEAQASSMNRLLADASNTNRGSHLKAPTNTTWPDEQWRQWEALPEEEQMERIRQMSLPELAVMARTQLREMEGLCRGTTWLFSALEATEEEKAEWPLGDPAIVGANILYTLQDLGVEPKPHEEVLRQYGLKPPVQAPYQPARMKATGAHVADGYLIATVSGHQYRMDNTGRVEQRQDKGWSMVPIHVGLFTSFEAMDNAAEELGFTVHMEDDE